MRRLLLLSLLPLLAGCDPYYVYGPGAYPQPAYAPPPSPYYGSAPPPYAAPAPYGGPAYSSANCGTPDQPKPCYR
jgi:hypothetical protein